MARSDYDRVAGDGAPARRQGSNRSCFVRCVTSRPKEATPARISTAIYRERLSPCWEMQESRIHNGRRARATMRLTVVGARGLQKDPCVLRRFGPSPLLVSSMSSLPGLRPRTFTPESASPGRSNCSAELQDSCPKSLCVCKSPTHNVLLHAQSNFRHTSSPLLSNSHVPEASPYSPARIFAEPAVLVNHDLSQQDAMALHVGDCVESLRRRVIIHSSPWHWPDDNSWHGRSMSDGEVD